MAALSQSLTGEKSKTRVMRVQGERWLYRTGLFAITALAGMLRFANLEALGYANHYYTAAVVSILQSWHNFFFGMRSLAHWGSHVSSPRS